MNTISAEVSARSGASVRSGRFPDGGWLLLGIAAAALAGNRFNVGLVGWVAAVPWLLWLRRTSGWRSRLWLLAALQVGTFLSVLKLITEPLPWFFALMFSVPMALGSFGSLLVFEGARRRLGDGWGLLLFPALTVVGEWVTARYSEMGTWGALAYTQLDNLPLLQLASLLGLTAISGLLAAVSALVSVLVDSEQPRRWRAAAWTVAALVLAAHAFGSFRLFRPLPGPLVTVAAVSTDIGLGAGGLPPQAAIDAANEALFARSAQAARQGAQVVVWNEGATAIAAEDEGAFVARGQALAREYGVDLVMAYVVPVDGMRRFENKYLWLSPEGLLETYLKHHPVPSEGSIRGTAPLVAHDRPYGRAAGAICYDYDFPAMGRAHATLGAGLVVLPSSDWRGIDPYHTQMAAVRGIEGGFSVVRSVRWATSGAFDALGVSRGTSRWFEGERLMLARVPATRIRTLYSRVGDVLPSAAGLVLLAALGAWASRARRAS